jgi:thiamine-phosphate pyrophosphorylase
MSDVGLYLATPVLDRAEAFLPLLEEALRVASPASLLLRIAPLDRAAATALTRAIAEPVQARGIALLVENAPELALAAGADGAHVTGAGPSLEAAIALLSPGHIVGAGGLEARHDAMVAGELGADYVTFGDWAAPLDLEGVCERVAWWAEMFTTPCVAVANELSGVGPLAAAGADFVLLGDCVWNDPRGVAAALDDVKRALIREEA